MTIKKELIFPLMPFFAETLLKVGFLKDKLWWEYFDINTLLLTISIWCLLMVRKSFPIIAIPRDADVEAERESLKDILMWISFFGTCLFSLVSYIRITKENYSHSYDIDNIDILIINISSMVYCAVALLVIAININPIRRSFNNV